MRLSWFHNAALCPTRRKDASLFFSVSLRPTIPKPLFVAVSGRLAKELAEAFAHRYDASWRFTIVPIDNPQSDVNFVCGVVSSLCHQ